MKADQSKVSFGLFTMVDSRTKLVKDIKDIYFILRRDYDDKLRVLNTEILLSIRVAIMSIKREYIQIQTVK